MSIMYYILHGKNLEEGKEVDFKDMLGSIPFIDFEQQDGTMGVDIFKKLSSPRHMKTHLPFQLWKNNLEKNPNVKIIQTIRNPKDTLVSYFHHFRSSGQLGGFNGTWDQYFEMFRQKRLPFGDFFEHQADWYKFNKDRKNSLVLVYEDMKKSHRDHVIKIAQFMGHDVSDKVIDIIVQKTSLKDMSVSLNEALSKMAKHWNTERSKFVRKGQVGDWVNYFSEEQSKYIDEKCKEYFEPLGLKFEYESSHN